MLLALIALSALAGARAADQMYARNSVLEDISHLSSAALSSVAKNKRPTMQPTPSPTNQTSSPTNQPTPLIPVPTAMRGPTGFPTLAPTVSAPEIIAPEFVVTSVDTYVRAQTPCVAASSQWSVFRGPDRVSELSGSTDIQLRLPAGTLEPDTVYTLRFNLTCQSLVRGARQPTQTAYKNFTTLSRRLIVQIKGGYTRQVRASARVSIDASESKDPDHPSRVGSFRWTCQILSSGDQCGRAVRGILERRSGNGSSVLTLPPNILEPLQQYRISVRYQVSNLTGWTSVAITAVPGDVPGLHVLGNTEIAVGKSLQLVAHAVPVRPSRVSDLKYQWYASSGGQNVFLDGVEVRAPALNVPISSSGANGLVVDLGTPYEFGVNVTDTSRGLSVLAAARVVFLQRPMILSFSCSPEIGVSLETKFTCSATANGTRPLSYRFTYNDGAGVEQVINTYGWNQNATVVLPRGYITPRVSVRDALGGAASLELKVPLFVRSLHSRVMATSECARFNASIGQIRQVLAQVGGPPTSNGAPNLGICASIRETLSTMTHEGRFDEAFNAVNLLNQIVEAMPKNASERALACHKAGYSFAGLRGNSGGCAFAASGCGCTNNVGSISDAEATMADVSYFLLDAIADSTEYLVEATGTTTAQQNGQQSVGTLLSLTRASDKWSLAASPYSSGNAGGASLPTSAGVARELDSALATLLGRVPITEDYSRGVLPAASQTLSLLFSMAGRDAGASSAARPAAEPAVDAALQFTACTTLDSVSKTVEMLMHRASMAAGLGSATSVAIDSFQSSARAVFADEAISILPQMSNTTTDSAASFTVSLPASMMESNSLERPTSTLVTTQWNFTACRGNGTSKRSRSVSISLFRPNGSSVTRFAAGGTVRLTIPWVRVDGDSLGNLSNPACEFWNTQTRAWDGAGCRYAGRRQKMMPPNTSDPAAAICECTHLTEFAILESQRDEENEPLRAEFELLFRSMCGIFSALFVVSAVQLARLVQARHAASRSAFALALIVAETLSRAINSAALGGLLGSFAPVTLAAMLCIPYTFSFWNFSVVLFQFVAIAWNTKISRAPFRRVRTVYIVSNTFVAVFAWVAFLGYALSGNWAVAVAAAAVFCAIDLLMALGLLYFGSIVNGHLIKSTASIGPQRMEAAKIWFTTKLVAACFLLQSGTWLWSATGPSPSILLALAIVSTAVQVAAVALLISLYWAKIRSVVTGSKRSSGTSNSRSRTPAFNSRSRTPKYSGKIRSGGGAVSTPRATDLRAGRMTTPLARRGGESKAATFKLGSALSSTRSKGSLCSESSRRLVEIQSLRRLAARAAVESTSLEVSEIELGPLTFDREQSVESTTTRSTRALV